MGPIVRNSAMMVCRGRHDITILRLVPDDDPSIRRLLVRVAQFVDPRIAITEASSGPGALSALRHRCFKVVITDYHTPGLTGLEVVTAADMRSPTRPVIVVSGKKEVEPVVLAAVAVVFAAKPCVVDRFATMLRSFLAPA